MNARPQARAGAPIKPFTTLDTAAGEITHFLPDVLPNVGAVLFQIGFRDGRQRNRIHCRGGGRRWGEEAHEERENGGERRRPIDPSQTVPNRSTEKGDQTGEDCNTLPGVRAT